MAALLILKLVNEFEAGIIRNCFERYKNGEKVQTIIERLNAQGIKTKVGSTWTHNHLARLIRNQRYIGKATIDGILYASLFPAIVDDKTFEACNLMMDEHKHKQRIIETVNPYILSGKVFCGACGAPMTAEKGTSHTGKIYNYYKCAARKKKKENCSKKTYSRQWLEDLVFKTTIEYVLKPNVINQVAEIVVNRFNNEIAKNTTIEAFENNLKEVERGINAIMNAIDKGIITKTTHSRLALEEQKDEIEDKLATEKSKQVKSLELEKIKAFINYFARKKYDNDQEKNEFFNSFINRAVVFDDKIVILYNTDPNSPTEVKLRELQAKRENKDVNIQNTPFELFGFERGAVGGESGI